MRNNWPTRHCDCLCVCVKLVVVLTVDFLLTTRIAMRLAFVGVTLRDDKPSVQRSPSAYRLWQICDSAGCVLIAISSVAVLFILHRGEKNVVKIYCSWSKLVCKRNTGSRIFTIQHVNCVFEYVICVVDVFLLTQLLIFLMY